jgi:hypothetical protein
MDEELEKQTINKCNEITSDIIKDLNEFLKFHTKDFPLMLRGFVFMEIAKISYVYAMQNAREMAIENIEKGGMTDLKGLLSAYKRRFDAQIETLYEKIIKVGAN